MTEDYRGQMRYVLDHGLVRLVDYMGSDVAISRAARVSYNAAWRAGADAGSDERLIRRLWADKHTSPFESVEFQFEVTAPIFVFRQWHRHRTWSFSEISGRYSELPEEFYVPDADKIGKQSKDNMQAREIGNDPPEDRESLAREVMADTAREAFRAYHGLLSAGVPRELARTVLPLSTYSHMFAKVDLLNLLKFLSLRDHPDAQYEIQVYASAMLDLIRPVVPVAVAAWEDGR